MTQLHSHSSGHSNRVLHTQPVAQAPGNDPWVSVRGCSLDEMVRVVLSTTVIDEVTVLPETHENQSHFSDTVTHWLMSTSNYTLGLCVFNCCCCEPGVELRALSQLGKHASTRPCC